MVRKQLTERVRRGLRSMMALAEVELNSGEMGAFDPNNGGTESDADDVAAAIAWLTARLERRDRRATGA